MPLLVIWGKDTQYSVGITRPDCVIGRTEQADLVLPDIYVSRRHAQISTDGQDYFLCDLNSANGTLLNKRPVGSVPQRLASGDVIVIGQTALTFVLTDQITGPLFEPSDAGGLHSLQPPNGVPLVQGMGGGPSGSTIRQTTRYLHVFLSHASQDDEFVSRLAGEFFRAGALSTWVDHQDIEPGNDWDEAVQRALDLTHAMVLVLTPASVASRNVKAEWNYFLEKQKPVYPVIARPCEVPFRLRLHQTLDFTQNPQESLATLVKVLKNKGQS